MIELSRRRRAITEIERVIKCQYARFFEVSDWYAFKKVAEYYLKTAAKLKKRDVQIDEPYTLLIRNIQKRLFIGISCELVLKAFYLKNGYGINKPKKGRFHLYTLAEVDNNDFKQDDTYTINFLIDQLKNVRQFSEHAQIVKGFKIAKVFRNKEGHIAVFQHAFDPNNYSDIETSLVAFYSEAFSERLEIQISMEANEKGKFKILSTSGGAAS